MKNVRKSAYTTDEGTAISETCLCEKCENPKRADQVLTIATHSQDADLFHGRQDVSQNDAVFCIVCGI